MTRGPLFPPGSRVLLCASGRERLVVWGERWQAGTAAHWVALTQTVRHGQSPDPARHRIGTTLREEVAACLVGGHGLPFETGLAAFRAVRDAGLLQSGTPARAESLERVLRAPLQVGPRTVRYRFPAQRAARLAMALQHLHQEPAPNHPLEVREWLLRCPGIGPKTASWVVRNHYGSDDVAVLDVHVLRAGGAAGVFDPSWTAARHYGLLEAFFLAWAREGDVAASDLDAVIWAEQAEAARFAASRASRRRLPPERRRRPAAETGGYGPPCQTGAGERAERRQT